MNLLSAIIFLPLMGAVLVLFTPERFIRQTALITSLLTLVLSCLLLSDFDATRSGLQRVELYDWIPRFGIHYIVGVDGLSLPMILLTALLSSIAIVSSWKIKTKIRGYFALFLLLQSSMTGVFASLDLFLFFIFWELMLLPMYFLIGIWGAPARVDADGQTRGGPYAAIKFLIYTLIGSLAMLIGIIWLWNDAGTFDSRLLIGVGRTVEIQVALWLLFFAAFAVKIPMVPFHTWLPDAHVEAPTPISLILAGVLLKMGTYGILRFNFVLFPEATSALAMPLAFFGILNILYGGLCAMAQNDLKRLVAYSSISHMGFVMLGMSTLTPEGLNGAVLQMVSHGTITAMLFLLVGVIYDRVGHRDLRKLSGLALTMPHYTGFVILAFFASLGLPGLSGFVGELLILLGVWKSWSVLLVALAGLGIVITAAYHLWVINRAWLGEAIFHDLPDLSLRETIMLAPLAAIVVWIGVYPAPVLRILDATLTELAK